MRNCYRLARKELEANPNLHLAQNKLMDVQFQRGFVDEIRRQALEEKSAEAKLFLMDRGLKW